jgi:MFS family permease
MHRHRHIIHFLKNRELNELYVSIGARYFALSMIGMFVPIYLLNLGYSFPTVMLFYAVLYGTYALFIIPAGKVACRFGFKHSILFSIPLLVAVYLLLYALPQYQIPIYIIAVIYGINSAMFWTGYHSDFSRFSDSKSRGKEVGTAQAAVTGFNVIGPVTGGLILTFVGFDILFILVSVMLLASAIPLFLSRDVHEPIGFSVRSMFTGHKIRDILAYSGKGIEHATGIIIWPIFLFFVVLNSYTSLGFVFSLSIFFSLVFAFVVGRFSDVNRRLVLRLGGLFNAAVWVFRAFARTPLLVYIADSLYGMSQTMVIVSFNALNYDKAREGENNIIKTIMLREVTIGAAATLFFIALYFFADYFITFLFAGGASLLVLLF